MRMFRVTQYGEKNIQPLNSKKTNVRYDSLQSLGSSLPSSQSKVPSQNFSLSRQEKVGLHGIVLLGHVKLRPSVERVGYNLD